MSSPCTDTRVGGAGKNVATGETLNAVRRASFEQE